MEHRLALTVTRLSYLFLLSGLLSAASATAATPDWVETLFNFIGEYEADQQGDTAQTDPERQQRDIILRDPISISEEGDGIDRGVLPVASLDELLALSKDIEYEEDQGEDGDLAGSTQRRWHKLVPVGQRARDSLKCASKCRTKFAGKKRACGKSSSGLERSQTWIQKMSRDAHRGYVPYPDSSVQDDTVGTSQESGETSTGVNSSEKPAMLIPPQAPREVGQLNGLQSFSGPLHQVEENSLSCHVQPEAQVGSAQSGCGGTAECRSSVKPEASTSSTQVGEVDTETRSGTSRVSASAELSTHDGQASTQTTTKSETPKVPPATLPRSARRETRAGGTQPRAGAFTIDAPGKWPKWIASLLQKHSDKSQTSEPQLLSFRIREPSPPPSKSSADDDLVDEVYTGPKNGSSR